MSKRERGGNNRSIEINFFSSKWNASGQSIEVNADLRIIYKKYGKLPVDNVIASMSYNPTDGYWYDISTESKLLETKNILEKDFEILRWIW